MSSRVQCLASIGSGLLVALSLPPFSVASLVWVALVPIFFLVFTGRIRYRNLFFFGWLFGFSTLLPTFYFALNAAPLDWLGVSSVGYSIFLLALTHSMLAAFLALSSGFFLVVASVLLRGKIYDVLTIAALFALFEFVRAFSFSFYPFTFGPGSIIGDHLGFGLIAFALAPLEHMRQWGSIIGVYGLGFLIAFVNAAFAYIFTQLYTIRNTRKFLLKKASAFTGCAVLVFVFLWGGGFFLKTKFLDFSRPIVLGLVQNNSHTPYSSTVRDHILPNLQPATDLVLLSEGQNLAAMRDSEKRKSILGNGKYRMVLESAYENFRNKVVISDTERGRFASYAKHFIVPHAEYTPYVTRFILSLFNKEKYIRQTNPGNDSPVHETPFGKVASLICLEIISPAVIRDSLAKEADLLLFSANISVVRGSSVYHKEILAMAQIWATVGRRFLAYSANDEPSFIIDPLGSIVFESPTLGPSLHTATVYANKAMTPAAKYPNIFLGTLAGYIGLMGLLRVKRKMV